jgi:ABC-2 type transport system permease protein
MVRMGLKRIFRYPWGLLLSLAIDPIVLGLNILLYRSVFAFSGQSRLAGYDIDRMIWYFAATSFIWYWIWNFTDRNIGQRVLSGDLTLDLIKPVSVFSLELSRAVALRISGVVFEFIPSLTIYALLLARPFMTPATVLQFALSAALAFLLFFAINFLIGLSANYIQNTQAASAIKHIVVAGLGGSFIPLEFFSEPVARVLRELPFASLFYWPIRFFLGLGESWTQFFGRSLATLAWIGLFILLDVLLWKRAVRHYQGAGG